MLLQLDVWASDDQRNMIIPSNKPVSALSKGFLPPKQKGSGEEEEGEVRRGKSDNEWNYHVAFLPPCRSTGRIPSWCGSGAEQKWSP